MVNGALRCFGIAVVGGGEIELALCVLFAGEIDFPGASRYVADARGAVLVNDAGPVLGGSKLRAPIRVVPLAERLGRGERLHDRARTGASGVVGYGQERRRRHGVEVSAAFPVRVGRAEPTRRTQK